MNAIALLTQALAQGGRVVFDPPDRPRLFAPWSLHEAIKDNRATVKEILRRAAILRAEATGYGPCPILTLPEHPGAGGCLSCGDPVESGHFRCPLCAVAVALALEGRL